MNHKIVDEQAWNLARKTLLEDEKKLTRLRDELAEKRRNLPWHRVDEDYVFTGESGVIHLSELFGDQSQLIVYHFMYAEGWTEGCKSCSFWADQYDAINKHLGARDAKLVVVSRAPYADFRAFKARMGWSFDWFSSYGTTFNEDFCVSFPGQSRGVYNYSDASVSEEMPGVSVFTKTDEGLFHTYSAYSRGLDSLNATYQLLDLLPKGRDEASLDYGMAWVRLSDQY